MISDYKLSSFFCRFPFGAHQSYESYCQPQQPLQTSHSPNTESRSAHSQSPVQYTDLTNYSQGHKKQQQQSTVSHHSDEESSGHQRQYPRYQSSPEQEQVCLSMFALPESLLKTPMLKCLISGKSQIHTLFSIIRNLMSKIS